MGFAYADRQVWIEDHTSPTPIGWYALCEAHADRLTPPLGWRIDDTRSFAPVLPFRREVA